LLSTLASTLGSGGPLNAPWGMAIAPPNFGDFGGMLLVANCGDGRINVFDPQSGAFRGALADYENNPIAIPGLRALDFGLGEAGREGIAGDPSALYFTAATASHGIFGSIQANPILKPDGVHNAADFSTAIAPNTWIAITGQSLSGGTRNWNSSDFSNNMLPTSLDGVSVTINGEPAFISYISPTQINALVPVDLAAGPVQIQVSNHGLASDAITATLATAAPAFFSSGNAPGCVNEPLIAALHASDSPVESATPGETISIFGTGFGTTVPAAPNGQLISAPLPLRQPVQISFDKCGAFGGPFTPTCSTVAQVTFSGLIAPGLYQINVTVPRDLNLSLPNLNVFPVAGFIFDVPAQAFGYLVVNNP
jgi:uncharacterized protein (TIGR03437 family)